MKKMRLQLERLEITSFETMKAENGRGTVRAYATNGAWTCAYHCTWAGVTCEPDTCRCPDTAECPIQTFGC